MKKYHLLFRRSSQDIHTVGDTVEEGKEFWNGGAFMIIDSPQLALDYFSLLHSDMIFVALYDLDQVQNFNFIGDTLKDIAQDEQNESTSN